MEPSAQTSTVPAWASQNANRTAHRSRSHGRSLGQYRESERRATSPRTHRLSTGSQGPPAGLRSPRVCALRQPSRMKQQRRHHSTQRGCARVMELLGRAVGPAFSGTSAGVPHLAAERNSQGRRMSERTRRQLNSGPSGGREYGRPGPQCRRHRTDALTSPTKIVLVCSS